MTEIVRTGEHSDGAPTIEGVGVRVIDVTRACEHSGYSPDEITQLYPYLSLGDVHTALAYYYDHIDGLRSRQSEPRRTLPVPALWTAREVIPRSE